MLFVFIVMPLALAAQNVGIGTDAPAARLQVAGESSFAGPAQLTNSGAGAQTAVGPNSFPPYLECRQSLSIGTTAKLTSVTLFVNSSSSSNVSIDVYAGDVATGGTLLGSSETLNLPNAAGYIPYTFNFSPGIVVSGGASITFDIRSDQLVLIRYNVGDVYPDGRAYFNGSTGLPTLDIEFSTTFTEAIAGVVATKAGRLGVGTTTPGAELDVLGSGNVSGTLTGNTLSSPNTVDAPYALKDVQTITATTTGAGSSSTFTTFLSFINIVTVTQPSRLIVDAHISRAQHTIDGVNTEYRLMVGATEIARTNTGDHDGLDYATVHLSGVADVPAGNAFIAVEYRTASGTEQWLSDADGSQFRSLRVQVLQAP